MLKGIGALFVITACASFGFLAEQKLVQRIRALSSILPALEILRAEIGNLLTPIPDALKLLSENAAFPASALFSDTCLIMKRRSISFFEAFSEALSEGGAKYGLYPEDIELLRELSPVLGRYGAEEQANKLFNAMQRLEETRKKACTEREQRGRLYKTMGVMLGIVLALVTL